MRLRVCVSRNLVRKVSALSLSFVSSASRIFGRLGTYLTAKNNVVLKTERDQVNPAVSSPAMIASYFFLGDIPQI